MQDPSRIRFGDYDVDVKAGELRRRGELVRLQELPFRLLLALLERPGELVSRAELRDRLWKSDTFVDYEAGLNTAIAKLREALGDNAEQPLFVETVPKRGYRWIGTLEHGERVAQREWRRPALIGAMAAVGVAAAIFLVYRSTVASAKPIVAVVRFDNETGEPGFDRLAQALTDGAVMKLASRSELAVIGNAAVLRTSRPFRDLQVIRDALHADYIVIGQVQRTDDRVRVMTHLIRAADQTHLWVNAEPLSSSGESGLESAVADRLDQAVRSFVR